MDPVLERQRTIRCIDGLVQSTACPFDDAVGNKSVPLSHFHASSR